MINKFAAHSVSLTLIQFDMSSSDTIMDGWILFILICLVGIGGYVIARFVVRRFGIQRKVLERRVASRTAEITKQKEELEAKSEELEKAYLEIQTKNAAIEEAFEHLSNSYTKLSDLNREKDGMMSIVAHDLRTPLNNIQGLIQLITLDDNLTDEQKDYVSTIKTVVKRGNEMIRDLLDINQTRGSKKKLNITSFGLEKFINDWRSNFEEQLNAKNQKLEVSGLTSEMELETDAGLVLRILDNLTSNAIKFSEKGKSIYLDLKTMEDQLKMTLRDEGPGISEEDQQKMFKPFTRLSAQPTDGEPSNGLGLSIIKSLSKQLMGKITVESELDVGTSFILSIPMKIDPAAVKPKESWRDRLKKA